MAKNQAARKAIEALLTMAEKAVADSKWQLKKNKYEISALAEKQKVLKKIVSEAYKVRNEWLVEWRRLESKPVEIKKP